MVAKGIPILKDQHNSLCWPLQSLDYDNVDVQDKVLDIV